MRSAASLSVVLGALVATTYAQSDSWWKPAAGTSWAIDLTDTITAPYQKAAIAYDADLYANNGSGWAGLKAAGFKTICYFSAGSFEDWRPDKNDFPKEDIGAKLQGWNGEWWINTKSDAIRTIMTKRMDLAVGNKCDAIDPDNLDVYDNGGGGFGLTSDDAINYIQFLTSEGHKRGLAVGLKNAEGILPDVVDNVDFAVNEQCQQYSSCKDSQPMIDANKPVFEIEYQSGNPSKTEVSSICDKAGYEYSVLIKHMDLDTWEIACPIKGSSTNATTTSSQSSSTASTTQSSSPASYTTDSSSDSPSLINPRMTSGLALVAIASILLL